MVHVGQKVERAERNWLCVASDESGPHMPHRIEERCDNPAYLSPTEEDSSRGYWYCEKHINLCFVTRGSLNTWKVG
jgi:hypothetical protein